MGDLFKTSIGIIAALVLIVSAYVTGKNFGYEKTDNGMKAGFFVRGDDPADKITLHGYYRDIIGPDKRSVVSYESVQLKYFEGEKIEADAKGDTFDVQNVKVHKEWMLRGYHKDGVYVMSYETIKSSNGNSHKNVGVYILNKDGADYKGRWIGVDSSHGVFLDCPYVLSQREILPQDAAKEFKDILERDCIQDYTGELIFKGKKPVVRAEK